MNFTSTQVIAEFAEFKETYPIEAINYSGLAPLSTICRALEDAIQNNAPLSLVRIGDGEGSCLLWEQEKHFPNLTRLALTNCLNGMFGPQNYTDHDFDFVYHQMRDALQHATVFTYARSREQILYHVVPRYSDKPRAWTGSVYGNIFAQNLRSQTDALVYETGLLNPKFSSFLWHVLSRAEIAIVSPYSIDATTSLARVLGAGVSCR